MKKIFTLLLLFCCILATSRTTYAEDHENEEDKSYLTIEKLEKCYWEQLEALKFPIITDEDKNLYLLIDGIREPTATRPAFGNTPYINMNLWIGVKDEYIDRFIYKCKRVVDLYNYTHDLQLTMTSETTDSMLIICVKSQEPDFIKHMVTINGELAYVKKDTIFWECAQNFGSGESGVIEETRVVQVNGVAYLDENGQVVSSYYGTAPKQIERITLRMFHICTEGEDLGWVYPTQLTCIDE